MFSHLQSKWNVTPFRLVLILITFAVGGSLTGFAGKKILSLLDIQSTLVFVILYIVVVTLLWPLAVLLVSLPFGQFLFFKRYLQKMAARITRQKGVQQNNVMGNEGKGDKRADSQAAEHQKQKLAIFASGAGSNAAQIIHYFKHNSAVSVALIVCNKPGAGVISIAAAENIPVLMVQKEAFFGPQSCIPALKEAQITFIVLAGFLWKIPQPLISAFPKRIINIHPALLPSYGGKGMYGQHVHQAVIENGEKESGITIHYVDEHYDNGDIIFQQRCPVLPTDTPETLAKRIHALEHAHFAPVINKVLRNL